ncbi:probable esterase PIR7A [Eucalyptus grandis]|uniref:probable esterase PIR7A n=1 Tax=Eucalyptus grandis TaxID=71139 RepID=UPI00192EE5BF|nr:probable esterase PIR7A [Eucalyptus grandis]
MQPVQRKLILTLLAVLIFPLCFDPNEAANTGSKHFVLVHGASHGAWCWYKVVTLLRSSGHNVTTIDLTASGINPIQASSLQSISDYFKPLRDVMEGLSLRQRVILVGHSFGGMALSHVMERYPKRLLLLCFTESSRRAGSIGDSRCSYDNGPNNPPTACTIGPMFSASRVYQLSPIQDWTLANTLVRPQRLFSDEDLTREITLSERNYGSVRRVAIISEDDKLIGKDFILWMIERNPPDQVLEVKGSDHMVMMSKPMQLFALLQHIANTTHY